MIINKTKWRHVMEISQPNLLAVPTPKIVQWCFSWKKKWWPMKMFELQFLSLFSTANFIFDIYYSTHTKEKDWQGFPFHFLIAFSEETFGRYVTGDYKLSMISLPEIVPFSSKKHSSHAVLVSLTRTHVFCYANEMNILRAFLCGSFFRAIDYHEFLRNNIIMMQIYSPMRKSGQHYFWKFLTTSLSGNTLPLKDCGSLAFHETKESQAARTTLWII